MPKRADFILKQRPVFGLFPTDTKFDEICFLALSAISKMKLDPAMF